MRLNEKEVELVKKIKELRINKKITQEELAKKAGLSQNYISQIEKLTRIPSLETIDKISKALGDSTIKEIYKGLSVSEKPQEKIDKLAIAKSLPTKEEELKKISGLAEETLFLPNESYKLINKFRQKKYYAYFMQDSSMEPEIKKGDILIIQFLKQLFPKKTDFKKFEGYFGVLSGIGETTIRKIVNIEGDKELLFQALNPHYYSYFHSHDDEIISSKFKTDEKTKKPYDVLQINGKPFIAGVVLFIIREEKKGEILTDF